MKKLVAVILSLVLVLSLTLCAQAEEKKSVTVGIAQFAVHGSLDNCREGFLQGLAAGGYVEGENLTVDYQNANADMNLAVSITGSFASNNYDLICAIATPIAVSAVEATADKDIPVVYTAVSAPEEAGLADENKLGIGNVTGSSDLIPVSLQLQAIRDLLPEAKNIGILYTVGEVNSQVQLAMYQEAAPDFGFEIVPQSITAGADIPLALPTLLPNVDCLCMLTDNTVVQFLDVVLEAANEDKIPVFGSEVEQVTKGCAAAVGLDYVKLGYDTGLMAARVLDGEDAASIPYLEVTESTLSYNSKVCADLGITLPEDVLATATDMAETAE